MTTHDPDQVPTMTLAEPRAQHATEPNRELEGDGSTQGLDRDRSNHELADDRSNQSLADDRSNHDFDRDRSNQGLADDRSNHDLTDDRSNQGLADDRSNPDRADESPWQETDSRHAEPDAQASLFADDELAGLRARWNTVQAGFVDDPRDCVQRADGLVSDVLGQLTHGFTEARSRLEEQWSRGEEASTEDLRVALKRYRDFFERLLAV